MADDVRDTVWSRGGAWVVWQFPLVGLALVAARLGPRLPAVTVGPLRWLGTALIGGGGLLLLAGLAGLGRNLTPFPKPRPDGQLVQSGPYGLVRHPVYGGAIMAVVGWALLHGRWAGLVASAALAIFLDQKANREERWLVSQFPEYSGYRRRVNKLIPWLY